MVSLHPEYVVDENKRTRAVLLPLSEWEKVIEELEELEDIRAYDRARSQPDEVIPFDQAVREIEEGYGK